MRENRIRTMWAQDETVFNGWLATPSSVTAEVMARQDWDSVTIDLQHGLVDYSDAVTMLQAISQTDTVPLARAPWNEPVMIQKPLDAGAYGIICPMINSREEAERFIGACRYHPDGYRSVGPIRAAMYAGADYIPNANKTVLALAMIETAQAVERLDEILTTPGLDGIFVGPSDLSVSLGHAAGFDPEFPVVMQAIETIAERCKHHGIPAGIHTGSVAYALKMQGLGYRFITLLSELRLIQWAAGNAIAAFRAGETRPMPPDGEPVMTGHVTVIGAGIVGMCTASWLQQAGLDVTVLDEDEPGMRCSYGNAGGICPGSCVPLAMPGMLRKVPGWLLDPEGPLFVRMAYLPRAVPWLVRFLAAGRPDRIGEVADALRALHGPTIERYRSLVAWAGCEELLVERGQLFLYESEAELAGDALGLAIRRDRGIKADILSAAELRQLEPALDHRFTHAVYLPEQAQCLNPHRLVRALAAKFVADGGHIERTSVVSLERGGGRISALVTANGTRPIDTVVMAAGAWSGRLLATAGIRVPLEAERGYHVTMAADPAVVPRIQSTWSRRNFVATPQEGGVRFAGTDEFAGLDAPPDERRALVLLRHGRQMVPGLEDATYTTWMGHRPGMPDSLPVIGRDPRYANLIHAFGHGHTGLMGASVTGHAIAGLLDGKAAEFDLAPYRIERFS